MSNKHASPWWRFLQDTRGVIAIMFAVAIPVVLMGAGMAIDFARLYLLKQELQQMADAATLGAGAIISNKTDALLRATAEQYLEANPIPGDMVTVTIEESKYHADTKSYELRLRGVMDTSVLSAFQIYTLTTTATSHSLRALPGPVELVLAVDTTTSMGTAIDGWPPDYKGDKSRTAALEFATKLLIDAMSEFGEVSIGVAPFSMYANVGKNPPDSSQWLAQTPSILWRGCIGLRSKARRSGIGDVETEKYPLANPSACMYVPPPPGYPHLELKALPELLPLRNAKTETAAILARVAQRGGGGPSFVPAGLLWAWNLLDSRVPFTEARTDKKMKDLGGRKVIILLTDGGNISGPTTDLATDSVSAAGKANADEMQRKICENIKAAGIEIYTVSFLHSDPNQLTQELLLWNCATSPKHFFSVTTVNGLTSAFQDINQQLVKVRLTN